MKNKNMTVRRNLVKTKTQTWNLVTPQSCHDPLLCAPHQTAVQNHQDNSQKPMAFRLVKSDSVFFIKLNIVQNIGLSTTLQNLAQETHLVGFFLRIRFGHVDAPLKDSRLCPFLCPVNSNLRIQLVRRCVPRSDWSSRWKSSHCFEPYHRGGNGYRCKL